MSWISVSLGGPTNTYSPQKKTWNRSGPVREVPEWILDIPILFVLCTLNPRATEITSFATASFTSLGRLECCKCCSQGQNNGWQAVWCYTNVYIHTYITLHYNTIQYITLHCIALHYIALHYITLDTCHTNIIRVYIYICVCVPALATPPPPIPPCGGACGEVCGVVCMYGWMDVWMYVCMYVGMYVSRYAYVCLCMCVGRQVCTKLCMHVGRYWCMYAWR